MADKDNKGNEGEKISSIAPEDIFIITELAQIGHNQLKQMIPDIRKVVAGGGASITQENLSHLESLLTEGQDTLVHFSNMCQYIDDAAKALKDLKNGDVGNLKKA